MGLRKVKQLLQKEKQLEMLTGSGMKEMDYREEITSLEHACSKLVVSLMNIVQQMERSVTEIFEKMMEKAKKYDVK